jgi:hypothetical protein
MSDLDLEEQETPDVEPDPADDPDHAPPPDEGDVTGPTTLPDEEREAAGDGPLPEPDDAQAQALSEKEIEKRFEKIAKENARHTSRISEIMEEGANDLLPCPLCSHFVTGWIYPPQLAPLPEEGVASTLAVLGMHGPRELRHASDTTTCQECDGQGEVETGSKRPGYESKNCGACQATGYVSTAQTTNGNGHNVPTPIVTGPTMIPQDVSSDPEVQHLKDRGFIVIPPTTYEAVAS